MTKRTTKAKAEQPGKQKPASTKKAKPQKAAAASTAEEQVSVSPSEPPTQLRNAAPQSANKLSSGKAKQELLSEMLSKKSGASIDAIVKTTGWLPHTSRAMISGLRKAGFKVETEPGSDGKAVYRITSSKRPSEAASQS